MTIVYPDTNAMWSDPFLVGPTGRRLLDVLRRSDATVHFSPVVVGELRNRIGEEAEAMVSSIARAAHKASRLVSEEPRELIEASVALGLQITTQGERMLSELLAKPSVTVDPYPQLTSEALISRSLSRRRPFSRSANGVTYGHNDTMIWEGLKEIMRGTDDRIVFVSNDTVFRNARGRLHSDLARELDDAGLDPRRVTLMKSLHQTLASGLPDLNRDRDESMLDLLWGTAADFPIFAFGWVPHPETGRLEEGEYVLDIDPRLQDVRLLNIVDLGRRKVVGANPSIVSLEARLDFEARVPASEWRGVDDETLSLWLTEPNAGTVTVGFSRSVRLSARCSWHTEQNVPDFDGEPIEVSVLTEPSLP